MVAHTATTPAPRATDPLRVSAPSPHSPPPRSTRLDDSTPDTLSSLLPPPTLTDQILDDLAVPQFSLAIVAMKHGLTLSGMLTWLNLPETREVLALRESAAYAHARHVAALNIGHAVETVASIVRDYNTTRPAREAQDHKSPGFAQRAATNARKAAWLLLQFARIVPVNESDLRRATGCLPTSAKRDTVKPSHRTASVSERTSPRVPLVPVESAAADSTEPVLQDSRATGCAVGGPTSAKRNPPSHRTASVNERTSSSDSPLPSQPVHPAGVLPRLPLASSLKDDANSPAGTLPDLPLASALPADADSPLASAPKADADSTDPPTPVPRELQLA